MENFNQIESDILNKIKNVNDRNSYEKTKTEADKLIMQSGIDYTILRPSTVFGKKMKNKKTYSRIY